MSALNDAQFQGTEAIAQSGHHSRGGGGGLASMGLELGVQGGKVKLQPWGTNAQQVAERFDQRFSADAKQPRKPSVRRVAQAAAAGRPPSAKASGPKPQRGVRMPPQAGAR